MQSSDNEIGKRPRSGERERERDRERERRQTFAVYYCIAMPVVKEYIACS
jgi:hypothetical protein